MTRSAAASPLLARGDTVGVVAPGFAVARGRLEAGLRRLRRMGFRVVLGDHVLAREGYFAGTDEQRLSDLNAMLRRPDVSAIWFARGGYGTARLLDGFAWRRFGRRPLPLIGYSDLSALFAGVTRRTPQICLYGPVVAELGEPRAFHAGSLRALLGGEPVTLRFGRRHVLRHGRARGRLLGGNLTVLAHLLGTRHAPDLRGAIVFLEDVGEPAYRLDRSLTHLAMSGALRAARAVALGSFDPAPAGRRFPPDRSPLAAARELLLPLGVPVVSGLPAGHRPGKRTLPLGGRAELDTRAGLLRAWPSP